MKGIILAGGRGTRLAPVTTAVSKQLLPIYDKPLIFYPLSVLMFAGIRDILVISRPEDLPLYRTLLGDGADWGLNFSYAGQDRPEGLPQAFTIARDFLGDEDCALVLGDNLFYGHGFTELLAEATQRRKGAAIFTYRTKTPERYGVLLRDDKRQPAGIVEKPKQPVSNEAIVGLYFFDNKVRAYTETLRPSDRGELEITDLIRIYLDAKDLDIVEMGRGYAWFDCGTHESMLQASNFVQAIEERQGLKIACPEEIAFHMGFIDIAQLRHCAKRNAGSSYGQYLEGLAEDLSRQVR